MPRKFEYIPIDEGIPIPPKQQTGARNNKLRYPWRYMRILDSFLIPPEAGHGYAVPPDLLDKGWKFTSRQTDEGMRVWRIE